MKIRIGTTILCGARAKEGASDFEYAPSYEMQSVPRLRATSMEFFHRGNRSASAAFTVARLHDTVQDCVVFMLEHPDTLPSAAATAEIIETAANGREVVRYIPGALVRITSCSHKGRTSFIRYSIVGQQQTKERPS